MERRLNCNDVSSPSTTKNKERKETLHFVNRLFVLIPETMGDGTTGPLQGHRVLTSERGG